MLAIEAQLFLFKMQVQKRKLIRRWKVVLQKLMKKKLKKKNLRLYMLKAKKLILIMQRTQVVEGGYLSLDSFEDSQLVVRKQGPLTEKMTLELQGEESKRKCDEDRIQRKKGRAFTESKFQKMNRRQGQGGRGNRRMRKQLSIMRGSKKNRKKRKTTLIRRQKNQWKAKKAKVDL